MAPLSLVVDWHGPHFDPARTSTLEQLLQTAEIGAHLCLRARALRERLVTNGLTKYGRDDGRDRGSNPRNDGRHTVLVTGQVEDDRSMRCGAPGLGNLDLLRKVRACEPHSRIIYKPHPDVEAGHRKGHVADAEALKHADAIDRSSSIAVLMDQVRAVHVLTSLAGFEALMRGLDVTTHGVPFYAGWGLTRDLGPVPERRTRRRTLDELVAATLIMYPRYLDPITRLPCSPEILVDRLTTGYAARPPTLVRLRRLQGRLKRSLGRLRRLQ